MEMKVYPLGAYGTNCYVVINTETNEVIVIDPGNESNFLINELEKNRYQVKAILITHAHHDHVGAVNDLVYKYNAKIYINQYELDNLATTDRVYGIKIKGDFVLINDNDILNLIGISIKCIHTPGHSGGGMCFLIGDSLFSGDTLFKASIGRTDMISGDFDTLIKSIEKKLLILDRSTKVYPGHGPSSSIAFEGARNPFLQ